MTNEESPNRIDRLMDAIDLLHEDDRAGAVAILRQLIREDNDFEDAWLWMSVAVDSLDQSSLCLDNVLRVNPANIAAATALHRIRTPEMAVEKRRGRLRLARDMAFALMWMLVLGILYALLITYFNVGG
ncbi:MAG: hypothetical protein J0L63_05845 [Anaerolineae bacterium]|nr:hypothetical protein [Anaerolineae bacterium]MBN8618406.1 hypothetical protein [Anaerolineae bacterium]